MRFSNQISVWLMSATLNRQDLLRTLSRKHHDASTWNSASLQRIRACTKPPFPDYKLRMKSSAETSACRRTPASVPVFSSE